MEHSRRNVREGREDVCKNANSTATVASCVSSAVVERTFTTATCSAIHEFNQPICLSVFKNNNEPPNSQHLSMPLYAFQAVTKHNDIDLAIFLALYM